MYFGVPSWHVKASCENGFCFSGKNRDWVWMFQVRTDTAVKSQLRVALVIVCVLIDVFWEYLVAWKSWPWKRLLLLKPKQELLGLDLSSLYVTAVKSQLSSHSCCIWVIVRCWGKSSMVRVWMHWYAFLFLYIAQIIAKCHSFPNMYDMLYAKVDRFARKTYLVQKNT